MVPGRAELTRGIMRALVRPLPAIFSGRSARMRPRGTAHRLTCTARGLVVMMSLLGCASAGPAHDPVPAAAIGFGGGQCGKPVSQRSGPWFCPTGNAQGEPLPAPRGAAVAARAGRVAADPHGHCTVQGCWSILDDYT